jgi:hypothetical protein
VQKIVTTNDNIEEHLSAIAFAALPKTHQDAIVVTRQLDSATSGLMRFALFRALTTG